MKRARSHIWQLGAAVLALLLLLLLPRLSGLSPSELLNYTPKDPLLAALVLMGLYLLKTLSVVLPGTILNVSAGILFPPVIAVPVALAGNLLELTLGYGMGRALGARRVASLLQKDGKAVRFLAGCKRLDAKSCFICRLLPLPVEPCSLFFAAIGFPFGRYLLASGLGLLPRMVPWVIAGAAIDNPLSPAFLVPFLICVCGTGGLFALHRQLQRHRQKSRSVRCFFGNEKEDTKDANTCGV